MKSSDQKPGSSSGAVQVKPFSIRGRVIFGTAVICVLFLGVGGWAATAQLTGAIIAPGSIVVERHVK